MDKLYYYVRKTDVTLTTQANDLNKIASGVVKTKLKTFFKSYENDTDSVSSDDGDSDDDADGNDKDNDDAASVDSVPSVDLNTVMEATKDGYMYGNLEQADVSQRNLVSQFRQAWGRQRKKLVHDYSITGWMLSPIPVVMEDAAKNHSGFHRNAVDRLITKLFSPSTDPTTPRQTALWPWVILILVNYCTRVIAVFRNMLEGLVDSIILTTNCELNIVYALYLIA
jgi:hypothetical protein